MSGLHDVIEVTGMQPKSGALPIPGRIPFPEAFTSTTALQQQNATQTQRSSGGSGPFEQQRIPPNSNSSSSSAATSNTAQQQSSSSNFATATQQLAFRLRKFAAAANWTGLADELARFQQAHNVISSGSSLTHGAGNAAAAASGPLDRESALGVGGGQSLVSQQPRSEECLGPEVLLLKAWALMQIYFPQGSARLRCGPLLRMSSSADEQQREDRVAYYVEKAYDLLSSQRREELLELGVETVLPRVELAACSGKIHFYSIDFYGSCCL